MKIKNILYISHFNGKITGAETGLLNIIKYLDRNKYRPLVLCRSKGVFVEKLEDMGVEVFYLDFPVLEVHNNEYNIQLFRDFIQKTIKNTENLMKILESREIDLVHTNVSVVFIGALAARLKGIPHIWHVKEILAPGLWSRLFSIFIPLLSNKVITVSRASGRVFNTKKCNVIYDGLDSAEFSISEANHAPLTIGFIGSIISWKGVHTLLMSATQINKILPETNFLVVGDLTACSIYFQRLQEFIRLAGLEAKVKFIGYQADIPKVLSALDIVVVPSRRPDPLPNVVIEAMASAKVVVASSCGGIPEAVIDGMTGFLFPSGDYTALSKVLVSLLQDGKLRKTVGSAARKLIVERFSAKAMSEKVQYLYEDALKFPKNNSSLHRIKMPRSYAIFFNALLRFFQAYLFFFNMKFGSSRPPPSRKRKKDIWMTDQMLYDECLSFCDSIKREKEKKNILIVTPEFPYPLHKGGNVKIYNHIKMLSLKHNIYLLSFIENEEERKYISKLEEFCSKVITVLLPPNSRPPSGNILLPKTIQYSYSEEFRRILMNMVNTEKVDLVQIDSIFMANYVNYIGKTPSVLIEHDVDISSFTKSYIWNIRDGNFFNRFSELSKLLIFKTRIYKKFGRVVTLSPRDKWEIEKLTGMSNIAVVPPGIDIDYLSCNYDTNNGELINNIAFVGYMKHYPNEDGAIYFCNRIFNLLKEDFPAIKLYIIGSYPTKRILDLGKDKNIIVTGFVEDVRTYLRNCSILVVPVRLGGGVRIKILEAMAMGIPVVSTSVGCNGIDFTRGKDIIIADRPRDFAEQIKRLLRDVNLRRELSINGRRLIEEKYTIPLTTLELNEVYQEVLNEKK